MGRHGGDASPCTCRGGEIDKSTGDESRQRATRLILVGSGARVSAARLTDRLAIKVERRSAVKAIAGRIASSPGHHQHEVGGSLPRAGARRTHASVIFHGAPFDLPPFPPPPA